MNEELERLLKSYENDKNEGERFGIKYDKMLENGESEIKGEENNEES